jgi:STE24 endopeptidase
MQAYQVDKWWFRQVYGLVETSTSLAMLWYGALPWLWDRSGDALSLLGWGSGDNEVAQTIALVLLSSAFSVVTEAPWSLFSIFVIEERHGFNKQTLGLWAADQLKSVALGLVFVPPIVGGLTVIMQVSGPYVALYLWAFTCGLSVFMMTVSVTRTGCSFCPIFLLT